MINIYKERVRSVLVTIYKIPIIGYILKVIVYILLLPRIIKKIDILQTDFTLDLEKTTQKTDLLSQELSKKVDFEDLQAELEKLVFKEDFDKNLEILKEKISYYLQEIDISKRYIRGVEKRLIDIFEKLQQDSKDDYKNREKLIEKISYEKERIFDSFYVAFENRFRGSKKAIQSRQEFYIPFVQKIVKSKDDIVLDIGCGRGEWLELLKKHEITAKGIDLNTLMVEEANSCGLDAINMDFQNYFKTLEDETISVITGFHIVEHLEFEVLITLFDESLRVLKRGGMIIFETPNPENLMVGSCSFYTDPTHKNPIPLTTLEFIASNRGFSNIQVHKLHPLAKPRFLDIANSQDVNELIYLSKMEQDYSIIGYKL